MVYKHPSRISSKQSVLDKVLENLKELTAPKEAAYVKVQNTGHPDHQ